MRLLNVVWSADAPAPIAATHKAISGRRNTATRDPSAAARHPAASRLREVDAAPRLDRRRAARSGSTPAEAIARRDKEPMHVRTPSGLPEHFREHLRRGREKAPQGTRAPHWLRPQSRGAAQPLRRRAGLTRRARGRGEPAHGYDRDVPPACRERTVRLV